MNTKTSVRSATFALALSVSAAGFTGNALAQAPKLAPAGDCKAMIAAGKKNLWFGRFSGRAEDEFGDGYSYPVAGRGCFESEFECRRWNNENLSITQSSGLMSCRPYNKRR